MTNKKEVKNQESKPFLKRDIWSSNVDKKIKKFFIKTFKTLPTIIYLSASILVIAVAGSVLIDEYFYDYIDHEDGDSSYYEDEDGNPSECNVLGTELYGTLTTYIDENLAEVQSSSYDVCSAIKAFDEDDDIKAIIIEIDSLGGYPVAGEEISLALKRAKKPTIAVIRESGLSAAYMAASGADKIFASKSSDVGSIGVTMSYLDYSEQNKRDGIEYISLSSGKFKDSGHPDKILLEDERNIFMRDLNILHKNFIELVAENRNIPIEKVEALADGSSMLGEMALENNLIDYIGGFHEAEEYLSKLLDEEVVICWE